MRRRQTGGQCLLARRIDAQPIALIARLRRGIAFKHRGMDAEAAQSLSQTQAAGPGADNANAECCHHVPS